MKARGFTIVELLIVIVVIAILATITIVAYNGVTARSQASAVASDLRATIKGFMLYKESTSMSTWALESDPIWNGLITGNPTIPSIITYNASFREFVPKSPQTTGLGTANVWLYDNEGDTYINCQANSNGTNLILQNVVNNSVLQMLDADIDDGDTNCGSLHLSGTSLIFNLSKTP